jgi:hypothetical protein
LYKGFFWRKWTKVHRTWREKTMKLSYLDNRFQQVANIQQNSLKNLLLTCSQILANSSSEDCHCGNITKGGGGGSIAIHQRPKPERQYPTKKKYTEHRRKTISGRLGGRYLSPPPPQLSGSHKKKGTKHNSKDYMQWWIQKMSGEYLP